MAMLKEFKDFLLKQKGPATFSPPRRPSGGSYW
jgi:hypothetical protein